MLLACCKENRQQSKRQRFKDVSSDEYYAQAVAWAKEKGIAQANSKGRFNPDAACTRAEIAAFLYRMSLSE
mgnify:CR=1 FL=1